MPASLLYYNILLEDVISPLQSSRVWERNEADYHAIFTVSNGRIQRRWTARTRRGCKKFHRAPALARRRINQSARHLLMEFKLQTRAPRSQKTSHARAWTLRATRLQSTPEQETSDAINFQTCTAIPTWTPQVTTVAGRTEPRPIPARDALATTKKPSTARRYGFCNQHL